MNCENVFCVYQSKGKCTLEEISIDISGECSECIYIDVADEVLDEAKRILLERFKEADDDSL